MSAFEEVEVKDGVSGETLAVNASREALTKDTDLTVAVSALQVALDALNAKIVKGNTDDVTVTSPLPTGTNTIGRVGIDYDGNDVSVQNPIPTDGDSVYVKDLDIPNCDNGDFSGSVTDYFDSLKTVNTDTTANNPKIIKLWFKRTLYSHAIGFGCDDMVNGFGTDITIKLLGSGEAVRFTKNYTGVDPNSFLAEFGPKAFNGVILEFNTASTVCLSNLTLAKSLETNATLHGLTPDGVVKDVNVTPDGDLATSDNSSGLAIAEGLVTGKDPEQKWGYAPAFGAVDGQVTVWDGSEAGEAWAQMVYQYSTSDAIDSVSSSSTSDTTQITVIGLDINWNVVVQTVTLVGQTRVPLPTPLIRVYRGYNDNSTEFVGHVFVYENTTLSVGIPVDTTKIRAIIGPDNQQTEMSVFSVPAGRTGFMRQWRATISGANKSSNYIMKLRARLFSKVFRVRDRFSISDDATSALPIEYTEPLEFPEKTDIEIVTEATAGGVSGASIAAGFNLVLKDN